MIDRVLRKMGFDSVADYLLSPEYARIFSAILDQYPECVMCDDIIERPHIMRHTPEVLRGEDLRYCVGVCIACDEEMWSGDRLSQANYRLFEKAKHSLHGKAWAARNRAIHVDPEQMQREYTQIIVAADGDETLETLGLEVYMMTGYLVDLALQTVKYERRRRRRAETQRKRRGSMRQEPLTGVDLHELSVWDEEPDLEDLPEVVQLRRDGYSLREISAETGIPKSTVKDMIEQFKLRYRKT